MGATSPAEQDQLVLVAPHTGYFADYGALYRLPMTVMWHAVMPFLTCTFGYFPGSKLGLGDDLPARFAMQWAGRLLPEIRMARSAGRHERMRKLLDNCATLERPALLVMISDGSPNPYRYRVRPPSFINLTILEDMCLGQHVADVVIILGSVDIVLGEVDR